MAEERVERAGEFVSEDGRAGGEDGISEEDSDAERHRRRRGRRGGRRRMRRESDLEPTFKEPHPPSEMIEIVPASEIEEREPAVAAASMSAPAASANGPPAAEPIEEAAAAEAARPVEAPTGEAERIPEPPALAAAQPQDTVQAVEGKPPTPTPRRGWWQRLMQS